MEDVTQSATVSGQNYGQQIAFQRGDNHNHFAKDEDPRKGKVHGHEVSPALTFDSFPQSHGLPRYQQSKAPDS